MKTASKVFVTLNLCWRIPLFALYFLAALTLMAGDPVFAGMTGLVGVGLLSGMIALFIVALIFVPGIVFGFIALVRLNRAVCRDDVPTWLGVCTLILPACSAEYSCSAYRTGTLSRLQRFPGRYTIRPCRSDSR